MSPLITSINPLVALISKFTKAKRPLITFDIKEKKFNGLFDTGADVSVISSQLWPHNWASQEILYGLQGAGSLPFSSVLQSIR